MSLSEERYTIVGHRKEKYFMTAKELCERVQEDSKSLYNWIASATELVRVCTTPSFPQEYACGIEIAILNCFAAVEKHREIHGYQKDTDSVAVHLCYNALFGISKEADEARHNYLRAIIQGVVRYHFELFDFNHSGPTYRKICDDWKNAMMEKYSLEPSLNFKHLYSALHKDFNKTMKNAESEGAFKEDDQVLHKHQAEIMAKLLREFS